MNDPLRRIEQQMERWELALEARIEDAIERHPAWMEKRSALVLQIEQAKRTGAENWALVRAGVETAFKDLESTYEALIASTQRRPPRRDGQPADDGSG